MESIGLVEHGSLCKYTINRQYVQCIVEDKDYENRTMIIMSGGMVVWVVGKYFDILTLIHGI